MNSYKVEKWEKVNISIDIQYMWRRVTVFNIQSMGVGDSVMGLQFKFHGMIG